VRKDISLNKYSNVICLRIIKSGAKARKNCFEPRAETNTARISTVADVALIMLKAGIVSGWNVVEHRSRCYFDERGRMKAIGFMDSTNLRLI
jgi:hypothetical protein